jgi:hypothetical protein
VKIRLSLVMLLLALAASVGWSAPIAFDEISFLVRMRETDASIAAQVFERRLLHALTLAQEAALKKQGVSETLLQTLRDPKLVVDEAEAAAFEKRRNERKLIASEAVVDSAPAAASVTEANVVPSTPTVEPAPTGMNLIIDRIRMIKHPIAAPYYVFLRVQEGDALAEYENWNQAFGFRNIGDLVLDIPINIVLKDIRLNSWATITLQLESAEDAASTNRGLKKHTAKFQILEGSQRKRFIPQLDSTPFMYDVFYHTAR